MLQLLTLLLVFEELKCDKFILTFHSDGMIIKSGHRAAYQAMEILNTMEGLSLYNGYRGERRQERGDWSYPLLLWPSACLKSFLTFEAHIKLKMSAEANIENSHL